MDITAHNVKIHRAVGEFIEAFSRRPTNLVLNRNDFAEYRRLCVHMTPISVIEDDVYVFNLFGMRVCLTDEPDFVGVC